MADDRREVDEALNYVREWYRTLRKRGRETLRMGRVRITWLSMQGWRRSIRQFFTGKRRFSTPLAAYAAVAIGLLLLLLSGLFYLGANDLGITGNKIHFRFVFILIFTLLALGGAGYLFNGLGSIAALSWQNDVEEYTTGLHGTYERNPLTSLY